MKDVEASPLNKRRRSLAKHVYCDGEASLTALVGGKPLVTRY